MLSKSCFKVAWFFLTLSLQTARGLDGNSSIDFGLELLERQLPAGQCSPTQQCADGSCCSTGGYCGRDPDHCTYPTNCVSNCGAKAECGRGAEIPGATCPLNVCCGYWGYCGTTADFCTTSGSTPCQSNCPQPASSGLNTGNVRNLVIGYWEGWALTTRSCAKRTIDDVPVDSLSHLNLAFAYIKPSTYEIYPMPKTSEDILQQITNLKRKAPGLKIGYPWENETLSGEPNQPVWGDLVSTPAKRQRFVANLHLFMEHWGFDGVDLDWEYPGAPDRGGHPEDGTNYVLLLQDIQHDFASKPSWGLSFTAPTSYWYLRWFPIAQMYQYVNWINLMTYDLHGSWDSPEDQIGSFVYAHTNLTEITDALDLFWRNNVPANKINLGIGFYGRSYTLSDPKCSKPGCAFSDPGIAGTCTGTGGVLSFDEIESMKKIYGYTPQYDKDAGVKYFAYNTDQWVSYDDIVTLQQKVDYANKQGLLGLFIWAIDLDTRNHDALAAVLGGKLGTFKGQNGVTSTSESGWTAATGNDCTWSQCGDSSCGVGRTNAGAQQWCGSKSGTQLTQDLCCPFANTPDPKTCEWDIGGFSTGSLICAGSCGQGQIPIASSNDPIINGGHTACFIGGSAQYCCDESPNPNPVCALQDDCIEIKNGVPKTGTGCPSGQNFVTYAQGNCDPSKNLFHAFCCDSGVSTDSCYWSYGNPALSCAGADSCNNNGDVKMIQDLDGGGKGCRYTTPTYQGIWPWYDAPVTFCCQASAMARGTVTLPVPLANLFPSATAIPDSYKEQVDIEIDSTVGGAQPASSDQNPNDNAFGFFILSGPPDEITSLNTRDGSHWELYNCGDPSSEERRTVQAVCLDTSDASNCGNIFKGGVAATVVEMPAGCGPGSYAMAVSLEPSVNHTKLPKHLEKRHGIDPVVYDFTFDFDFEAVNKRDQSNVLMRIDYSDDHGYWDKIVAAPKDGKRKRDLEVERDHGGDYKSWLEHTWHKEKRSMDIDDLHKRWFSGDVREWFSKQKEVDIDFTGVNHHATDNVKWILFQETLDCDVYGIDEMFFEAYANLVYDVHATAGLTLIGTLGNLRSFDESHVWFRSKGRIKAEMVFNAFAKLSFHTGQVELFGAANFGSPFRVPGIVTIGPNFSLLGQISGDAVMHFSTTYSVDLANWDFSQRYPAPSGTNPTESESSTESEPMVDKSFDPITWDLSAEGDITTHIIPKITLGIVFDTDTVPNAAIDIGVDAYAKVYGTAKIGSSQDFVYCYGVDGGATLYAEVQAPSMFGISNYYPLIPRTFTIVPKTCSDGSTKRDILDWSEVPAMGERFDQQSS